MFTRSINAFSYLVKSYKNTLISSWKSDNRTVLLYDRTLLCRICFLLILGFIMMTSASMPLGSRLLRDPFFFAKRQICYLFLAVIVASFILHIPIKFWQKYSIIMLFISFIMLITVLFGHIINGATRWIGLGPIHIQPAEVIKIIFCCYLSDYLSRKFTKINNNIWEAYKPLAVLGLLLILLLEQPDFGTAILLFITTLVMLFLSGVKFKQVLKIIILSTTIISVLILNNPYRIHRITSFLHPWKDPYNIGYQLTQSLIAFGRGNILLGRGLGNSRQKFSYLPEAHTDFIFSVLGEELGYIGAMIVIYNIFFIAFRAMSIGHRAIKIGKYFSGFFSCSIGIWFSLQIIINIGASTGILPTKGLTLPLISYGGSSLIVVLTALMVILRVDYETRFANIQAFHRRN
ncbi:cell division protein FtsW [Candidatus Ishikawella capsulata]|nr:cell division protein FtsW [Candidatus Ishikawaella capsulata]